MEVPESVTFQISGPLLLAQEGGRKGGECLKISVAAFLSQTWTRSFIQADCDL